METNDGGLSDDVLTLAQNLMKNGIVSTHGEAIHMAEQMLGKALGEKPPRYNLENLDQSKGNRPLKELVDEVDINLKKMPAGVENRAESENPMEGSDEDSDEDDDDSTTLEEE